MKDTIREIIEKSELYYTAENLIDSETFDMIIDELVEDLADILE